MSTATRPSRASRTWARRTWTYLCGHWELYLFLLPGLVFAMMFKLLPMSKIVIAFKNFKPLKGIAASPWVGFAQFEKMFADPDVLNVIKNTLEINLMIVIFVVPLPMFLAIMLNEITFMPLKKGIQTLIYIPHFFTWVVVYSVFFVLFGSTGMVNTVIKMLGGEEILFFMKGGWFRFLLVISNAWKGAGWGTIVYLSAITAIDAQIYEAATIDGASKTKQFFSITVPMITPVIFYNLVTQIAQAFQEFNGPYIITQGGPRNATTLVSLLVYNYAFKSNEMGMACALAWVMFIAVALLTVIAFTSQKHWVYYAD